MEPVYLMFILETTSIDHKLQDKTFNMQICSYSPVAPTVH